MFGGVIGLRPEVAQTLITDSAVHFRNIVGLSIAVHPGEIRPFKHSA